MSGTTYPKDINYYDQQIDTKISLKAEFKTERKAMRALPTDHVDNHYISEEMQEKYLVKPDEDDLADYFVDSSGDFLDGEYNFVLTCEEEPKLLCDPTLHHSYLANGKKVLAAGSLVFDSGTLQQITNNSGHYRPTDEEMLAVIKALYTVSGGKLQFYKSYCSSPPVTYPVSELVETNNFSSVTPLKENELIDINTGKRKQIVSNYDEIEKENLCPERRFGRSLAKELDTKYQDLLTSSSTFFKTRTFITTTAQNTILTIN